MRLSVYITKLIIMIASSVILIISPAAYGQNNSASGSSDPKQFISTLSFYERLWLKEHPVISVAIDPGWPPVEFRNERGEPSGMSMEYLKIIERKLGVEFRIVQDLSWQEMYRRLKRREIDMTTSVAVTQERSGFWSFTKPYMNIPIVIATQMNVTYIANLNELSGKDADHQHQNRGTDSVCKRAVYGCPERLDNTGRYNSESPGIGFRSGTK